MKRIKLTLPAIGLSLICSGIVQAGDAWEAGWRDGWEAGWVHVRREPAPCPPFPPFSPLVEETYNDGFGIGFLAGKEEAAQE